MIFRQLYEPVSSTYTYLLGCEQTGLAVLIDPVTNAVERDLTVLADLGLKLAYTLDTHIHADHITSARTLKERTDSQIAAPAMEGLPCTDVGILEGQAFQVGSWYLTLYILQATQTDTFPMFWGNGYLPVMHC